VRERGLPIQESFLGKGLELQNGTMRPFFLTPLTPSIGRRRAMLKSKPVLFAAGLIASVALFAASEVRATDPCSRSNDFLPVFDGVTPLGGGIFRYSYTVGPGGKEVSKISSSEFSIQCGLVIPPANQAANKTDQNDCGEGGQANDKYARDIPAVSVITVTPQVISSLDPVLLDVVGSDGQVGFVGWQSKSGKSIDGCIVDGPILASIPAASASSFCLNLAANVEAGFFEFSLGGTKGADNCIVSPLDYFDAPNCPTPPGPTAMVPEGVQDANFVVSAALGGNQACDETIVGNTGSPFIGYQVTSGGTPYRLCIDLMTGLLVAETNCDF